MSQNKLYLNDNDDIWSIRLSYFSRALHVQHMRARKVIILANVPMAMAVNAAAYDRSLPKPKHHFFVEKQLPHEISHLDDSCAY